MTKPIVITLAAQKGGVGKTSIALNFGDYLASKGIKTLLIDLDSQLNLTTVLKAKVAPSRRVANIFQPEKDKQVSICSIYDNLDLIAGSTSLNDSLNNELIHRLNGQYFLYQWFHNKNRELFESYQVLIFDTHPSFDMFVKNALYLSDYVISPLFPDVLSLSSQINFRYHYQDLRQEAVDKNGNEEINAQLYFVGNGFRNHSQSSQDFKQILEQQNEQNHDIIAYLPNREVFRQTLNQRLPLTRLMQQSLWHNRYQKNADEFYQQFDQIIEKLNIVPNK